MWQAHKSVDVSEFNGTFTIRLNPTGKYSGQNWKITPSENKKQCNLSCMWQGEDMLLEITQDNQLILAPKQNN